jgi:hypothetical protein
VPQDTALLRGDGLTGGAGTVVEGVVDLTGTGADGFAVERDLRGDGVVLEMADRTTLVPVLTIGDDRRSVDRLVDALRRSLTRRAGTARSPAVAGVSWRISPQPVLCPRDAFFAPRERVPAAAAAGRVAAETISPYPPPTRPWRPSWSSGAEGDGPRPKAGGCHSGRLRWPRITPRQPSSSSGPPVDPLR